MNYFIISATDKAALIGYMQKKPFEEVEHGIHRLRNLPPIPEEIEGEVLATIRETLNPVEKIEKSEEKDV